MWSKLAFLAKERESPSLSNQTIMGPFPIHSATIVLLIYLASLPFSAFNIGNTAFAI